jgi:hypothetical protein
MNWEEKHAQQIPSIHSESRHLFIKLFFVFFIGLVFGGCGCILSLAMREPLWIFNGAALISTSFLSACAALAGCATKQFAQVGTLTTYERTTMSCREIDVEMARTVGVQQTISDEDQFDGRSVLAFLGDFGIGNALARSSAQDGVNKRMQDLTTMRAQKGCGESTKSAQLN